MGTNDRYKGTLCCLPGGTNLDDCLVGVSLLETESNFPEFHNMPLRRFSHFEDNVNGIQVLLVHDIYDLSIYIRVKDKDGNFKQWEFVGSHSQISESGFKNFDDDVRKAIETIFQAIEKTYHCNEDEERKQDKI